MQSISPSRTSVPLWGAQARLLIFLSGPPDLGAGKTVLVKMQDPDYYYDDHNYNQQGYLSWGDPGVTLKDPKARAFYEQAAVAAASLGVTIDLYATAGSGGNGYLGLNVMEPLCNSSGGSMYLYPSVEESTLPQDIYRCQAVLISMLMIYTMVRHY